MNNEELQKLKALALAASPGPWVDGMHTVYQSDSIPDCDRICKMMSEQDSAYIAAASPDVVLALIERIEALTVDAERYKHVRKHSEMYYFAYRNPDMGHAFSQAEGKIMDQVVDASMAGDKK